MEKIPNFITFDAEVVNDRMQLLATIKPKARTTYLLLLAAKDESVMIDFTKPVEVSRLAHLNRLFDIDAAVFFTVSDQELQENIGTFLRSEE